MYLPTRQERKDSKSSDKWFWRTKLRGQNNPLHTPIHLTSFTYILYINHSLGQCLHTSWTDLGSTFSGRPSIDDEYSWSDSRRSYMSPRTCCPQWVSRLSGFPILVSSLSCIMSWSSLSCSSFTICVWHSTWSGNGLHNCTCLGPLPPYQDLSPRLMCL